MQANECTYQIIDDASLIEKQRRRKAHVIEHRQEPSKGYGCKSYYSIFKIAVIIGVYSVKTIIAKTSQKIINILIMKYPLQGCYSKKYTEKDEQ